MAGRGNREHAVTGSDVAFGYDGAVVLIDSHTHVFAPWQVANRAALCASDATFAELYADERAALATADDLASAMYEANLDGAVAAGFAFTHERDIAQQSEYLVHTAKVDARVVALAAVNPAIVGWESAARGWLAAGARGFGELRPYNQGWDPLGRPGRALCALAQEAGAILLWHVSEAPGHSYPGKAGGISPTELCQLATAFPRVRMIAAHQGAGLSFFLQMPEVREALANVFFDTAATSLLYDEQSVTRLVALAGADRVLFGSDYPLLSPRRQLQRITALLPGDVAQAVCGGNADTLFSDLTNA
jgi:predicted TIM-barrel fold metal-dependent hydrolase